MKTDFKEDNKAKLLAHPVVKIFEETMDTIQAGNIDEVFDLNEEEKQSFEILEKPIKRIRYRIMNVKEENEFSILSVSLIISNLSKAKKKLFEKVEKLRFKLNKKSEKEIQKTTLKWFKEIIDEEVDGEDAKRNIDTITIKYKKIGSEWIVEDDSELVKAFGFRIE